MSPEWVSILALAALFIVGTLLPINMGALAFVAAWLVGMYSLGMPEDDIIAGMNSDLVLTLIGITYLFAIARNNGTVDLIVQKAVQAVGGRVALIPWVMFAITGVLTAIGAASPAACAIIGPIALGFAGRYKISPLLMGMLVVHGAQAGGFSPISIYGTITNSVMADNDLPNGEIAIFLTSLIVNLLIAVALFAVLGGRELMSRRIDTSVPAGAEDHGDGASGSGTGGGAAGTGAGTSGGTMTAVEAPATSRINTEQVITLVAFLVVAVLALVFERNIGFCAITAAVLLVALYPSSNKGAVSQIAWATILLLAGVTTFVAVLEEAGTPEYVGQLAAGIGTALLAALLLCYVGGIVSAFASSTALLPIIIPIAIPLIDAGGVGAVALVAALAVSSTIVDVSPFSTNGAIMLANCPDTISQEKFYKQILGYSAIVVAVGPLLVWAAVVLPGWG
ncbi:MAG TPA: SLC13 family permease [Nocardioides sp.]|uniref:SLC13 family permease n=1 Tax=Nocardioides sp. TaxID=35761 RepID=UPI002D7F5C66|nr:SLC13 family permease [Nocardioides sp.]HET6651734.1 SLC13 family permease [Nocardioides sp.]